jgi:hypothetical protein
MSITSPDARIAEYNPVVATTVFSAGFPVFDNSDLALFVNGAEEVDFTVSATYVQGISYDAAVTISGAGVTGQVFVVGRRSPRRTNRFASGAPLPTWAQNLAFDTIEGELQEAKRETNRAIKAAFGEVGPTLESDIPDGSTLIKSGDDILAGPTVDEVAGAEGYAESAQAASATTQSLYNSILAQVSALLPIAHRYAVGGAVQSINTGIPLLPANAITLYIDGVYQFKNTWAVAAGVITPVGDTWPGDGTTQNVEVVVAGAAVIAAAIPLPGSVGDDALAPLSGVDVAFAADVGNGLGGINIGAGDPLQNPPAGKNGSRLRTDGHGNWIALQTLKYLNPTEFIIYAAAAQGRATAVSGGNVITSVGWSSPFLPSMVGKPLYYNRSIYQISQYISPTQVRITEVGGAVVNLAAGTDEIWHYVRTTGSGTCDIVGSQIRWKSGDGFIPFIDPTVYTMTVDGVAVIPSGWTNATTLSLASAPGNKTNVAFTFEVNINDQLTTFRVQKLLGAHEENFTRYADAKGAYVDQVQHSGDGRLYPYKIKMDQTVVGRYSHIFPFGFATGDIDAESKLHAYNLLAQSMDGASNIRDLVGKFDTVYNNGRRAVEIGTLRNFKGAYIQSSDGAVTGETLFLQPIGGEIAAGGNITPISDNTVSLGKSSLRFTEVWAVNGTVQTSARETKTDIADLPLGLDFVKSLRPVSYRIADGGTRSHWGLIYDEVKAAMQAVNTDSGLVVDPAIEGEEGPPGLRYQELFAVLIKAINELAAKVEAGAAA